MHPLKESAMKQKMSYMYNVYRKHWVCIDREVGIMMNTETEAICLVSDPHSAYAKDMHEMHRKEKEIFDMFREEQESAIKKFLKKFLPAKAKKVSFL